RLRPRPLRERLRADGVPGGAVHARDRAPAGPPLRPAGAPRPDGRRARSRVVGAAALLRGRRDAAHHRGGERVGADARRPRRGRCRDRALRRARRGHAPETDRVRRRLYLMRHGAVDYVDAEGRLVAPDDVPLTPEGRAQVIAARELLSEIALDRVITSGLPRTLETAELVVPGRELEAWPDLREITGARVSSIPPAQLEEAFVRAFQGVVPNEKRFLGGETIGELFDRVLPS